MRIVVAGGPKTGKTALSEALAAKLGVVTVRHTDELISKHDWEASSDEVAGWFDAPSPWIVEGVMVPCALEKWFARNQSGTPADVALYLQTTRIPLTRGQATMAKGCLTVWSRVGPALLAAGCNIVDENWSGVGT
jgi:hypothetical protein